MGVSRAMADAKAVRLAGFTAPDSAGGEPRALLEELREVPPEQVGLHVAEMMRNPSIAQIVLEAMEEQG